MRSLSMSGLTYAEVEYIKELIQELGIKNYCIFENYFMIDDNLGELEFEDIASILKIIKCAKHNSRPLTNEEKERLISDDIALLEELYNRAGIEAVRRHRRNKEKEKGQSRKSKNYKKKKHLTLLPKS